MEYDEYDEWLIGDWTSVVGSWEVPSFGARVGVVGDPAVAVGVAAIAFFQKSFFWCFVGSSIISWTMKFHPDFTGEIPNFMGEIHNFMGEFHG